MDAGHFFALIVEVFFVDLMLSADNAVVIALACRSVPPKDRRWIIRLGTAAAIALRIFLGAFVGLLVSVPGLRLLGGVVLLVIAVNLIVGEETPLQRGDDPKPAGRVGYMALLDVIIADLVMSLDNILALGGISEGNLIVLGIGVLFSVPLLMGGSRLVGLLIHVYPQTIIAGGALLGWIAGDIVIHDPLVAGLVSQQAPFLTVVVPALCALFVILEARIVERDRAKTFIQVP
jgi:YjbE family integral membrane protein